MEFYSGEVQPVSGTSSVNPTPGPTPVPSMPGSAGTSNGNGTSPFLELLLSLLAVKINLMEYYNTRFYATKIN